DITGFATRKRSLRILIAHDVVTGHLTALRPPALFSTFESRAHRNAMITARDRGRSRIGNKMWGDMRSKNSLTGPGDMVPPCQATAGIHGWEPRPDGISQTYLRGFSIHCPHVLSHMCCWIHMTKSQQFQNLNEMVRSEPASLMICMCFVIQFLVRNDGVFTSAYNNYMCVTWRNGLEELTRAEILNDMRVSAIFFSEPHRASGVSEWLEPATVSTSTGQLCPALTQFFSIARGRLTRRHEGRRYQLGRNKWKCRLRFSHDGKGLARTRGKELPTVRLRLEPAGSS
ncbi:hypothetical protein CEXT_627301, partial [Caerostris extrusa]